MLLGCLTALLVIVAIYLLFSIGLIVIPFVALFFLITAYIAYKKSENLSASKMQCPNCNSKNVKISSLKIGVQTTTSASGNGGFFGGIGFVSGNKNSNTLYSFKRQAICHDCGFNYDYLTEDDVCQMKDSLKNRLIISIVFFVVALILSVFLLPAVFGKDDNSNTIGNNTVSDNNVLVSGYIFGNFWLLFKWHLVF